MAETKLSFRYHKLVQQDLNRALHWYEQEAGGNLAAEFEAEFRRTMKLVLANPRRCHFEAGGKRRANLRKFPYHFIYSIRPGGLFMLVLRHNKRHPATGLNRS